MVMMTNAIRRPWHLWVVGALALFWTAGGAFDFTMTQTRNETYMGQFSREQLAYFYGFPIWIVVLWGISVWSGVLGAILLLLRRGWAVPVFWWSCISTLATALYTLLVSDPSFAEIAGSNAVFFSLIIIVISGLLIIYAKHMQNRGVLN